MHVVHKPVPLSEATFSAWVACVFEATFGLLEKDTKAASFERHTEDMSIFGPFSSLGAS